MRGVTAVGVAMLGSVLFAASGAFGAGMPAGGSFRVFSTPNSSGTGGTVVFTGAIGDYGKTVKLSKGHTRFVLKRGTFEINGTALQAKLAKDNPAVDLATCSAASTVTAPVSILDCTGLYKGISGTINATVTFAVIGPFYTSGKNKGKCNLSNSAPTLAQYSSIQGNGTVKFS